MADLILASGSPRRRELLDQIGVAYRVQKADVDESIHPSEGAQDYVLRLAQEKARAVHGQLPKGSDTVVLGSDTAVVFEQEILGKPKDHDDFHAMMRQLSGDTHQVMTAVALCNEERCEAEVNITEVRFRPISDDELEAYWLSGEPHDKAGGYGIQGWGAVFVEEIYGSYSCVVGLPLLETFALLQRFGVPVWQSGQQQADHS